MIEIALGLFLAASIASLFVATVVVSVITNMVFGYTAGIVANAILNIIKGRKRTPPPSKAGKADELAVDRLGTDVIRCGDSGISVSLPSPNPFFW